MKNLSFGNQQIPKRILKEKKNQGVHLIKQGEEKSNSGILPLWHLLNILIGQRSKLSLSEARLLIPIYQSLESHHCRLRFPCSDSRPESTKFIRLLIMTSQNTKIM